MEKIAAPTRKIAVIDLDSVAYSIGNGVKLLDSDGNPIREDGKRFVYRDKTEEELVRATDAYMKQILEGGEFTHYIGYMKGYDTTDRRKTINPDYKANRSSDPPKWWDFVLTQLHLRWSCVYVNGMETDDAVNITRLLIPDSHIVAIDGDLLGLEGTHYNWRKKLPDGSYGAEWVTVTAQDAALKFWSDMICGQVGDNIKGVPGKGRKYFERMIFDNLGIALHTQVLDTYIDHFGEYDGITEFYKNYCSLFILQKSSTFMVPEPIKVKEIVSADIKELFEQGGSLSPTKPT